MRVNWKWLERMARNWRSGTRRDFPDTEQTCYRLSLGLNPTPDYPLQPKGTKSLDVVTRRWK